jgi:hypothetical protein
VPRIPLALLAALIPFLLVPAAQARLFSVQGAPAPGPAGYDRVWVETFGSSRARNVLVLVPGTSGGIGSVAPVARDLAQRVRGLQVWVADRREHAFEDQRGFTGDAQQAIDYYLGGRYDRVTPEEAPFVSEWGLGVAVRDLRRVVLRARDGGRRRVLLGGHSRGASTAAAYAAWDFGGRPGHKDLAGLVLVDGGLLGALGGGATGQPDLAAARAELERIRSGAVFYSSFGSALPAELTGLFGQLAGFLARRAPDARSALARFPLLPADFRPKVRVTNEAFLGTIFDATYSTAARRALQTHSGRLRRSGRLRGWESGELTPMARLRSAFGRVGANATDWYFPQRLILDIAAANPMRRDAVGDLLGLRLWHTRSIGVPLYAYQTNLTQGLVLDGARRLRARADVPRWRFFSDTRAGHLDPVLASPSRNSFVRSVVPWLRRVAR